MNLEAPITADCLTEATAAEVALACPPVAPGTAPVPPFEPPTGHITLIPDNAVIEATTTLQYRVMAVVGGVETDVTAQSTFSVSNVAVGTMDATGKATGVALGNITVTALWSGLVSHALLGVVVCASKNIDLLFLVENSTSMGLEYTTGVTRLAAAKTLSDYIIAAFNFTKDKAGVIVFNETAAITQALTNTSGLVTTAISVIPQLNKQTNMAAALQLAYSTLLASSGNTKLTILLTSGENTMGPDPVPSAALLRTLGNVIVVGLSSPAETFYLLRSIANQGSFFSNSVMGTLQTQVVAAVAYSCGACAAFGTCNTKPAPPITPYGIPNGTPCTVLGPLDIVFVFDLDSSMSQALNNIQINWAAIAADASTFANGNVKMGLVTFRDGIVVNVDLALSNSASMASAVAGLVTGGSGNVQNGSLARCWDEALRTVINNLASGVNSGHQQGNFSGAWRSNATRMIVLVTSALPSGFDNSYDDIIDRANSQSRAIEAAGKSIKIEVVLVKRVDANGNPLAVYPLMREHLWFESRVTGGIFSEQSWTGDGVAASIQNILRTCGSWLVIK